MTEEMNSHSEHLIEQAHLAMLRHSPSEARACLQKVIVSDPNNIDANRMLDKLRDAERPQRSPGPPVYKSKGGSLRLGVQQVVRPRFFAAWNLKTLGPAPGWVQALFIVACIAAGIAVTYIPFHGFSLGLGGHFGLGALLGLLFRFLPRKPGA